MSRVRVELTSSSSTVKEDTPSSMVRPAARWPRTMRPRARARARFGRPTRGLRSPSPRPTPESSIRAACTRALNDDERAPRGEGRLLRQTMDDTSRPPPVLARRPRSISIPRERPRASRSSLSSKTARAELVASSATRASSIEEARRTELDPTSEPSPALRGIEAPGPRPRWRCIPARGRASSLARRDARRSAPARDVHRGDSFALEGLVFTLDGGVGTNDMAFDGTLVTGTLEARSGGDVFTLASLNATLELTDVTPISRPLGFWWKAGHLERPNRPTGELTSGARFSEASSAAKRSSTRTRRFDSTS